MLTAEVSPSRTSTRPEVPRIPVTMVEVRMFRLSPEERGAFTLKKSFPADTSISSLLPLLRISTLVLASSFTTLVLSRVT